MTDFTHLRAGDTAYLVRARHMSCMLTGPVSVTLVGRRWLTVARDGRTERVDRQTGAVDGGAYSSPGALWPDEASYLESVETENAIAALRQVCTYNFNSAVPAARVWEIVAELKGEKS